jgi:hypothetical protein
MLPSLSALIFAAAGGLLVWRTNDGASDASARLFVGLACAIAASGGVLSLFHELGSPIAWSLVGMVVMAVAWHVPSPEPIDPGGTAALATRPDAVARLAIAVLGATAAIATIANAVMIVATAPGAWDALTYHLPRMALAVQNGAYWDGPVNFWAQIAHPTYSTALFVFSAVMSAHNEHASAIWQFAAALIAAGCVRRIARLCGAPEPACWAAALLFLVIPQTIVQGAVVGNDLLLAAITAFAVERVLRFGRDDRRSHLVWIALATGLGLGMKLSFVCQIATLGLVAALCAPTRRRAAMPLVALAVGVLLALPSGYLTNLRRWGSIVGPPVAQATHTFAHMTFGARAHETILNTIRFATDFVSLDGMPRVSPVLAVQHALRQIVMRPVDAVGIDLSTRAGVPGTFIRDRPAFALESHSYWGIAGLLLIIPAVLISAISRERGPTRALAWGTLGFLVVQAASGPYDPFRGRYFLSAATLATPLAAMWFAGGRPLRRAFVMAAVTLSAVTGVSSSLLRTAAPLISVRYRGAEYQSILSRDRADQLARNRREYAPAIRALEATVPANATVAIALPPGSFEYPFFGPHLQRVVRPVGGDGSVEAAPEPFLVFSDARRTPRPGDVHLGVDWWLSAAAGRTASVTGSK